MKKHTIYLAYGSNLNLRQMAQRCPTAEPIGTTELQGYDLKFRGGDGHAVATVEPGEGNVPALLWKIQPKDEAALDVYEGWPSFYRKEEVEVELDGKPCSAIWGDHLTDTSIQFSRDTRTTTLTPNFFLTPMTLLSSR